MRSLFAFAVGLGSGWALRSVSESPEGAGEKLLEAALTAKGRFGRWAAVERERLEDMLAEARANAARNESAAMGGSNGVTVKDESNGVTVKEAKA